jgi:hypothetical protein
MSFADEPLEQESAEAFDGERSRIAEKVKLPAIFLIIVGVLNVLGALYATEEGVRALLMKEKIEKEMDKAFEDQKLKSTQLSKQQQQQQEELLNTFQGWFGKSVVGLAVTQLISGLLGLFAAAITIFGGVRMLSLRSRGLAILGAIVACIPCLSATGCCGLGEGIGIWSLIVLMSADVKAAFR